MLDQEKFDIEKPHQTDIHKVTSFVRPELDREVPPPQPEDFVEQPKENTATVRQLYVRREDVEKHGYTEGCGKCAALRAQRSSTRPHSAACRKIFTEILSKTTEGAARVARNEAKLVEETYRQSEASAKRPREESAEEKEDMAEGETFEEIMTRMGIPAISVEARKILRE